MKKTLKITIFTLVMFILLSVTSVKAATFKFELDGGTKKIVDSNATTVGELKEEIEKLPNRKEEITECTEIQIKYKGYIEREKTIAEKMHRLENINIKDRFNYSELHEISTEGRQKLSKINPQTLAQASRIPGVSPSDINVLLVLLNR